MSRPSHSRRITCLATLAVLLLAPVGLAQTSLLQTAYLKASNTDPGDQFGNMIDLSGATLVVGAPREDSSATGVNGDSSDDAAPDSGAVYVYIRDGGGWTLQAYLKASNTGSGDWFGKDVAIDGDTIVVGAWREDSGATKVGGDQANNSKADSGAAYVFARTGTTWSQQAYLKSSSTQAGGAFGDDVAISGDTVVVGAIWEDTLRGAADVFIRSGGAWSHQQRLQSANSDAGDYFGKVSISMATIVIGASGEDSSATGIGGNETNNQSVDSGAAYVFTRNGATWSQQAYLKASNTGTGDWFGADVGVSGDLIAIGAHFEDSGGLGVGGDQFDNNAINSGAVYIFKRTGSAWGQDAYLKATNTDAGDVLGRQLDLDGSTLAVSALGEDSQATGVEGDASDDSSSSSGAVYVFERVGGIWAGATYVKASNTGVGDLFGRGVTVDGTTIAIAANFEDSAANGIGGDQADDSAPDSGAAYVFDHAGSWTDLGGGTAGSAGALVLSGSGALAGGTPATVALTNAPSGALMVAWISLAPTPFMALGGTVHAFPFASQLLLFADAAGSFTGATTWPTGIAAGTNVWFQFLVQDASTIHGITLSNGLLATTP